MFEAEVYNSLYEMIYDKAIDIVVTNEAGESQRYNYVTGEGNSRYSISDLDEGVYSYRATTQNEDKIERFSGQFIIKKQNTEALGLTANFDLLKQLADQSGGQFYTLDSMQQIGNNTGEQIAPSIIHSEAEFKPVINLPWVFFLLLLLATTEWFVRKYTGHY